MCDADDDPEKERVDRDRRQECEEEMEGECDDRKERTQEHVEKREQRADDDVRGEAAGDGEVIGEQMIHAED